MSCYEPSFTLFIKWRYFNLKLCVTALFIQLEIVLLETFDLFRETHHVLAVWRCAWAEFGVLSMMNSGGLMMPRLCADSWTMSMAVSYNVYNVHSHMFMWITLN